jgi:hypothetical protein
MKKLFVFLSVMLLTVYSCKKPERAPVGPTDIRVRNLSALQMNQLTVNTYDSTYNYGTLNAGATTGYHRFDRAYRIANISAMINGVKYKTDTAIYTYEVYLSTVKATYLLDISNDAQHLLKITNIILESALK